MGEILLVQSAENAARTSAIAARRRIPTRRVEGTEEALLAVRTSTFAAAIIDVELDDGRGLDLAQRLIGPEHRLPVLLFGDADDRELVRKGHRMGAEFGCDSGTGATVDSFIHRALTHRPSAAVDAALDAMALDAGWSPRQKLIVRYSMEGMARKEIASRMDTEEGTCKAQIRSLLAKSGEPSLNSLIRRIHARVGPLGTDSRAGTGAQPLHEEVRAGRPRRSVGGGWVLVVDDVPENARSYARLLQQWVTSEIACTAASALALAERPGLVGALVDVRMGQEDGIDDVARPLKRRFPALDVRIISGANGWEPDVVRATRAGLWYILKDGNLGPLEAAGVVWGALADQVEMDGEGAVIGSRLDALRRQGVLSPLQLEALGFAVRGLSYPQIAARVGTGPDAVTRISARMKAKTGKSLAAWAEQLCTGTTRMLRRR